MWNVWNKNSKHSRTPNKNSRQSRYIHYIINMMGTVVYYFSIYNIIHNSFCFTAEFAVTCCLGLFSRCLFFFHLLQCRKNVFHLMWILIEIKIWSKKYITFRFDGTVVLGKTLKNESNRPCVDVFRALWSFLAPFLTRSSLNCLSPHKNFTKPSSSGSDHFNL